MKLKIGKLLTPLHLADYHPHMVDQVFYVWANPTKKVMGQFFQLIAHLNAAVLGIQVANDVTASRKVLEDNIERTGSDGAPISPAMAVQILATHGLKKKGEDLPGGKSYQELNDAMTAANVAVAQWYGTIWSQHENKDLNYGPDEALEIMNETADTDPDLWGWLMTRTQEILKAHREGTKKK